MVDAANVALIVGLVGVAVAILERGYKRYLEEKKLDPTLKFDAAYLLNLLVSTGIGSVLATAIIPQLIAQLGQQENPYTGVAGAFINFLLGYLTTFRILDGLNNSTDKKMEIAATAKTQPQPTK